jgi:hypothetical protein
MGVDARTGVRVLELHNNPQMRWPPPEVTRQGGEVVVDFLKSATNDNMMMRNKVKFTSLDSRKLQKENV